MDNIQNKTDLELQRSIEAAVATLKNGEVVGIPTETVYGLAAKISDDNAIRKIFSTKNRPFFDPLIVHVTSIEQAKGLVSVWPPCAQLLAERFWPGPLTLVLPKKNCVSDLITSGLETVALRMPRHPIARMIIERLGEPIAAPSANKFGRTSPSEAIHVRQEFENSVLVVDGGPCEVGIESTIIKLNETPTSLEITVLRAGSIVPEQIRSALKSLSKELHILQPGRNIEAPGQVKHHYMPTIPVLFIERSYWNQINGSIEAVNKALQTEFTKPCQLLLSESPEQAARELYGQLRRSSAPPADLIIFIKEPYQEGELWSALLDRMSRASTYRLSH